MIRNGWSRFRPLFFGTLLFALSLGCAQAGDQSATGIVSWIYDGDTLKIEGIGKVRLLGIDAPENEASQRDRYLREQGVSNTTQRHIAREALQFVIANVKGKKIRLQFDGARCDHYGRTLAYLLLPDGRNLNRLLLERGYAVVYRRFDFRLKEEFLRAEAEARAGRVGLWLDFAKNPSASGGSVFRNRQ